MDDSNLLDQPAPVRSGEELNVAALQAYLLANSARGAAVRWRLSSSRADTPT